MKSNLVHSSMVESLHECRNEHSKLQIILTQTKLGPLKPRIAYQRSFAPNEGKNSDCSWRAAVEW